MKKEIFAVVPIGKKMHEGKALYGIQLRLNGLENTEEVWKTLPQYCSLEKQIKEIAFDFELILDNQLAKTTTDQQKLQLITDLINQCKTRPDITNLITFRQFFQLTDPEFQYLDEWNRVNVGVKDMAVVALAWDAGLQLLISLHRPHSKAKIITNFFKQLLSKQTQPGIIRFHSLTHKWNTLNEIVLQSEPSQLQWRSKSGMLLVSTHIGIYIYTVMKAGQSFKHELIDFVKIYNPVDFRFGEKSANLYVATSEKLHMHSINKQFTMELSPREFNQITAIELNKTQTRLYCAERDSLKIFDVSEPKQSKQLANIDLIDTYSKLKSYSDKFLFGVSKAGYISVYQIKPVGKQRLTTLLTSIDSPSQNALFAFNQRNQMIITSNGQYIVLISTKNVPLFAGGAHKQPITAGIFDVDGNLIVAADLDGNVVFYNLNFKIGNQQ